MKKIELNDKLLLIESLITESEESGAEEFAYIISVLKGIRGDLLRLYLNEELDDVDDNTFIELTLYDDEFDPSQMH